MRDMIVNSLAYPAGDLQSWQGDPFSVGDASVKALVEAVGDEKLARVLAVEGLVFNDTHFVDAISGLPFAIRDQRAELYPPAMLTQAHDVIDAHYYRLRLRGEAPGQNGGATFTTLMTLGAVDRLGINPSFLSTPIEDHVATSFEECHAIVSSIEERLKSGPYFKRLWFRGQRQEHVLVRRPEICALLGFGETAHKEPSLIPSLGRHARNTKGYDYGFTMFGNHWWKKPFLIWVIRQNPGWLDHYPEFQQRVEDALRNDDDTVFRQILGDIQFDPRVPTEVDDLRQWFFAFFKYGMWVLVLQQYGQLASMLDVTWDLDTAVYFTHAKMESNRFGSVPPEDGRLIYVFAESRESGGFRDATELDWGDSDWNRDIPPRIAAQRCGCLINSSLKAQNLYGSMVIARIYLKGDGCISQRATEQLFPPPETDLLYRTLLESRPVPGGLY